MNKAAQNAVAAMTPAQILAETRRRFMSSPTFRDAPQAVRESWIRYLNNIAGFESGNRNIDQIGGGPAAGYFQIEGAGGSDTLTTAANRLNSLYPGNPLSASILSGAVVSAKQLSRDEQKALMYGNIHNHPKTRIAAGVGHTQEFLDANPGARHTFDVWRESHWGGSDPEALAKNLRRFYAHFPDAVPTPEHQRLLGTAQVAAKPPQPQPQPVTQAKPVAATAGSVPFRAGTTAPSAPVNNTAAVPSQSGDLNKQSQSEGGFHTVELGGVRNDPLYWGLRAGAVGSAAGLGYAALREGIRRRYGGTGKTNVVKPMLAGALIGTVLGSAAASKYGVNIPGYKARSWEDVEDYVNTTTPDIYKYGSDSKYRGLLKLTGMEKEAALPLLAALPWLGKALMLGLNVSGAYGAVKATPKAVRAARSGNWREAARQALLAAAGASFAGSGLRSAGSALKLMGRAAPGASRAIAGTTLSSGRKMFAPGTLSRKLLGWTKSKEFLARRAAQPFRTVGRADAAIHNKLLDLGAKAGPRTSAAFERIGGGVERAGRAVAPLWPAAFIPVSGQAQPPRATPRYSRAYRQGFSQTLR